MAVKDLDKKLENLSSGESNWKERAEFHNENRGWIRLSRKLAISIIMKLKDLRNPELMIQRIKKEIDENALKGSYNFSIKDIVKIEKMLNCKLVSFKIENKNE